MDKKVFERADKLNHFLMAYPEVIKLYCNYSNGCNYNDMAYVLRDIDAINPNYLRILKKLFKRLSIAYRKSLMNFSY